MICIYHSRDLDGMCSGAIVKKRYPDCKLIGYDYGKPFPWDEIISGLVIMVDVSLPMDDMARLSMKCGNLIWIDHHASAIKELTEFNWPMAVLNSMTAVVEDGISACEGAWKYLFPDLDMPMTVSWLGQYDTWRNSDLTNWNEVILPFQYGMRLGVTNADNFPQEMLESESDIASALVNKVFIRGDTILSYQKEQNAITMRGSFVINFKGLRALCCNGGGFNSQAFESVWNEELHDLMMPFKYDGKKWTFSMYTTKDIDLSMLAKEMGGGGHKKACGFQVEGIPDFISPALNETRELLLATTRNLGHPAYGESTATTMAIDQLREKAFDFLGIPKNEH